MFKLLIFLLSLISCSEKENLIDSIKLGEKFDLSEYKKEFVNVYDYTISNNFSIKEYEFYFYDGWYFTIWVNDNNEVVLKNVSQMQLLKKPKTYYTKKGYSVYTKKTDLNTNKKNKSISILEPYIGKLYQVDNNWFVSFLGYENNEKYPTNCSCELYQINFDYFNNLK